MPLVEAPSFVRPAYEWVPNPDSFESGRDAVDLAAASGLTLDPWQAWAVEQILAERGDCLAAFEAAVIVGRQNGKGTILESLALNWLFLEETELILWSAHEFKTAAEAFRRMRVLLQGAPDLWPLVDRVTTANGDEAIELTTGQRLKFIARSKASGRGFTGDKIILDEAYDLDEDDMAALIPTLATRPDPQIIYTSSAGMADSHVLRAARDRGRAGGDPSLCWLEWCATPYGLDAQGDDAYDLDDRVQWRAANPGVDTDRITPGFIEKERRALPPDRFARERLGVWDKPELERPLDFVLWDGLGIEDAPVGRDIRFFIDCAPNLSSASVAGAVMHKGMPYVSLAAYGRGTDWLIPRVVELRDQYSESKWQFEGTGPASAFAEELYKARVRVEHPFNGTEMARACGHLQKLVKDRMMMHSGDPAVSLALRNAVKRDVGDPGLWAWGRRKSSGDISPLVACTGALWLLETTRKSGVAIY